jgi:hypothetical protein
MDNQNIEFTLNDRNGNRLWCDAEGNVKLRLSSDRIIRDLGSIFWYPFKDANGNKRYRLCYAKNETSAGIFRKYNAWSIPDEIVRRVEVITIFTKECAYRITSEKALKHAKYLHFMDSGIERKIYVNMAHWSRKEYIRKDQAA